MYPCWMMPRLWARTFLRAFVCVYIYDIEHNIYDAYCILCIYYYHYYCNVTIINGESGVYHIIGRYLQAVSCVQLIY